MRAQREVVGYCRLRRCKRVGVLLWFGNGVASAAPYPHCLLSTGLGMGVAVLYTRVHGLGCMCSVRLSAVSRFVLAQNEGATVA
jgi:hypothetical protein